MKVAKILVGNPNNKKGLFNNFLERTKNLMQAEPNVDCYMIRIEYGFILKLLKRKFSKISYEEYSIVDGVKFKNLWITMGFLDYFVVHRLYRKVVISPQALNKFAIIFKDYDLISCHGIEAIYLAKFIKQNFKIPYVATWHGSDINIMPFRSDQNKIEMKNLLEAASHNFFVSQKLMQTSNAISKNAIKSVLYTGPSKIFYKYSSDEREILRYKYQLKTTYTIGFIGNLVEIKNVLILPLLFKAIQKKLNNEVSFVVVGDGDLSSELEQNFFEQKIENLFMFGKQEPDEIPNIMNCLDILVLPSLNEGLPLVTLEAYMCGVHVVGSDRGGIPEVIGNENCFELDESFIDNVTNRILDLLNCKAVPELPVKFSWNAAVDKELQVHKKLVDNFKI